MITKIEIENFRCIKQFEGTLDSNISIIAGCNNLGKSTILNAINWVITDSLYGDLEDIISSKDMTSLKPITYTKGDKVKVSLTIEKNGITKEFSREYFASYKRGTDEVTKHENKYYVEGEIRSKADDFYSELYEWLDYSRIIKSNKIREVNLFTDPNYALNKLETQQLRQLMVECGCSITDDEAYALTDNDYIKENALKFLGKTLLEKLFEMKKVLKRKVLDAEEELKTAENKLQDFKKYPSEFDNSVIETLNNRNQELMQEKVSLTSNSDLEYANKRNKYLEEKASLNAELSKLEKERFTKGQTIANSDAIDNSSLYKDVEDVKSMIKAWDNELSNSKSQYERNKATINAKRTAKIMYGQELATTKGKKFVSTSRCPMCDYQLDQSEQEAFEKQNAKQIEILDNFILNLNNDIASLEKSQTELVSKVKELENLINLNQTKLNNLNAQVQSKALEKDAKLKLVNAEIDAKVSEVKSKLANLHEPIKTNVGVDLESLNEIDNKISKLNETIAEQYALRSNVLTKLKYQSDVDKKADELNTLDYNYNSVRDLLKVLIERINYKASELFGIEFVMLEENISNDGYTETCYAKVDGVPFEHLNTSQKIIRGIQFIDKLKQVMSAKFGVGVNQLPILIDKLECLADINDLHNLNFSQIICTKVTNDKEITIKGE